MPRRKEWEPKILKTLLIQRMPRGLLIKKLNTTQGNLSRPIENLIKKEWIVESPCTKEFDFCKDCPEYYKSSKRTVGRPRKTAKSKPGPQTTACLEINMMKLYEILEEYGSLLKDLQNSDKVLNWIYEVTQPISRKEFLKELIKTSPTFLKWLIKMATVGYELQREGWKNPDPMECMLYWGGSKEETKDVVIDPMDFPEYVLFTHWESLSLFDDLDPHYEKLRNQISRYGREYIKSFGFYRGVLKATYGTIDPQEVEEIIIHSVAKYNVLEPNILSLADLREYLRNLVEHLNYVSNELLKKHRQLLAKQKLISEEDI